MIIRQEIASILPLQLSLGIEIFQEGLPLRRALFAIGHYPLVIHKLRYPGVAVVEIVMSVINGIAAPLLHQLTICLMLS